MAKLILNPGTPQAREFPLKPGKNFVGRGFANDVKVEDASVSTSHAQILFEGGSVSIKDLGSTNGTFINHSPVTEATLQPGHLLRLGGVELLFQDDSGSGPVANPPLPPPVPTVGGVRIAASAPNPVAAMGSGSGMATGGTLRIGRPSAQHATAEAPPQEEQADAPPLAPVLPATPRFCKFHPKSPARFMCRKCNRSFCDFCVTSRDAGGHTQKLCRTCGVELMPLQVQVTRESKRNFFVSVPGAFVYPFRGMGILILILATGGFAALGFLSAGILAIGAKIVFYGFLFLFMQNIIFTTTADEKESLGFPDASGIIGAAFTLAGVIIVSFGLPIGLLIAKAFGGVDVPTGVIIGTGVLGCFYFPMAFLAVAMKDTVVACNPMVVVPAIFKIPFQYLFASILLMGVFGIRMLGSIVSGVAGDVGFATTDMSALAVTMGIQAIWAFLSVYLLTVNIRILGLLYNANKEKLDWF